MQKTLRDKDLLKQYNLVKINLIYGLVTVLPVIAVAIFSRSLAMATDIFDYAFNITSSLIGYTVLRRCLKNERGIYDFGFGKLESLSALVTSILMLIALSALAVKAAGQLVKPPTEELNPLFVGMGILIQSIGFGLNFVLWKNAFRLSKKAPSPVMEAQWRVNRKDALGNAILILSLSLGLIFIKHAWAARLDPAAAIVMVILTVKSFLDLIRNSLSDLLDHTLDERHQFLILKRLAENEKGYERFYDVRSRKSGSRIFIDISIGFDPARKVGDALDFSGRIKERLESDIPNSEVNIIIRSIEEFEETLDRTDFHGTISPLDEAHLEACLEIAGRMFHARDRERVKKEFLAAIHPDLYAGEIKQYGIEKPRYWVGMANDRVVGFVGMAYDVRDPDVVWGGFMATRPGAKSSDLKIKLLLFRKMAFEVRQTGRKYFRLITTNLPGEENVNKLYDYFGLAIYRTERDADQDVLYYRQGLIAEVYERLKPGKNRRSKNAVSSANPS